MKTVSYKEALYQNYYSTHAQSLYGSVSMASLEKQFGAWDAYFFDKLPTNRNSMILDIGCGSGSFVYYLHQRGYSKAIGIDISKEQVESGIRAGILNLLVEDFRIFLARTEQRFDMVIARDVIEHFDRQEAFEILCLVCERLKEDGVFVMQVPNGQGLHYSSIFYGDYTHEMAYTESSVRQLALNSGYKKVRCYPTGPVPKSFFGFFRTVFWWFKVKQIQFWKIVETGSGRGIFTSNLIAFLHKK